MNKIFEVIWRMKQLKNKLLVVLFFTSLLSQGQVYQTIEIGKDSEWNLGSNMYYFSTENYITPANAFNYVKKVQAIVLSQSNFKSGYDSKYYWFYLKLKNDSLAKTIVLTFSRSDIHHFNCFAKRGNKIDTLAITGDALPFASRPIPVNDYAVPISLSANEATEVIVLVDKRFEFIEGRFKLYESNHFFAVKRYDFGVFMGYLGVMFTLVVFNLFLWVSLKDKIHLLFIAQLICSTLCLYTSAGFLNEFLPFAIPYRTSTLVVVMAYLWTGFNFLLVNSFLKLNRNNSRFYLINYWLALVNLLIGALCLIGIFIPIYPLSPSLLKNLLIFMEMVYSINTLFALSTFIEQLIRRNVMAKLYGIAYFFVLMGFVLSIIHRNSSLNLNNYLNFLSQSLGWVMQGVFFEQIILALGLTIRYNMLRRENLELEVSLTKTKNETARKVIETQETERQRLAKDLHDDLGGTLSAIKGKIANEKVQEETLSLVEKAIDDLRLVSRNLMPPELENEGIVKAVLHTVERIQSSSSVQFTFISFGTETRLSQEKELNIYRIISESVNNILKHAKATQAIIQLVYHEDYLHISIEDNGIGIKKNQKDWGIGLKNINSRVEFMQANINIDSSSDTGTTIMIQVPFS